MHLNRDSRFATFFYYPGGLFHSFSSIFFVVAFCTVWSISSIRRHLKHRTPKTLKTKFVIECVHGVRSSFIWDDSVNKRGSLLTNKKKSKICCSYFNVCHVILIINQACRETEKEIWTKSKKFHHSPRRKWNNTHTKINMQHNKYNNRRITHICIAYHISNIKRLSAKNTLKPTQKKYFRDTVEHCNFFSYVWKYIAVGSWIPIVLQCPENDELELQPHIT